VRVAGPLPTLQLTSQPGNAWQRALQPGQVLQAVVVSSPISGTALLRVGGLELVARSDLALPRDQPLLLEVVKAGDQPTLRVVRAEGQAELLAGALRRSLPRHGPPAGQLGRIAEAAKSLLGDAGTAGLGRDVLAALSSRAAPTGTEPAPLRQALAQSGLFFEARLAQGQFDAADLKAILLRMLARLKGEAGNLPAGPDAGPEQQPGAGGKAAARPGAQTGGVETLRQLVEDALAGVRWQQISSLPDEAGRGWLWCVGLPLQAPDDTPTTLWLRVAHDADGREPEDPHWTLDLSLTIAPLGPLHVHASLRADRVFATIWAEDQATAGLVAGHLHLLGAGLERAGLAVGHLAARAGRPATAADQPAPHLHGLLDERA
jgi:hypothetical protein